MTVAVAGRDAALRPGERADPRTEAAPRVNILVCVKRVPADRRPDRPDRRRARHRHAVPRLHVSPHEECAVEEAVRLVEAHGGSSTVLTLGPAEAAEQLRDAMAIGIDRAILLETDGGEWDPIATAAAIVEAVRDARRRRAVRPPPVRQRGCRLGRLPGGDPGRLGPRPAVRHRRQGASRSDDGAPRARREAPGGGWEVFEVPLPAVVRSRRASTCRATRRCRAGCGRRRRRSSGSRRRAGGRAGLGEDRGSVRSPAEQVRAADDPRRSSGPARGRAAVVDCSSASGSWGSVSGDPRLRRARGGEPDRLSSRRSRSPAARRRGSGRRSTRSSAPGRRGAAGRLGGAWRVDARTSADEPRLDDYAPAAWASGDRAVSRLGRPRSSARAASAGRGPRPRRRPDRPADGRERHRGRRPAIRGGSPASAGPAASSRRPGSTAPRLLTVAPHAVAARAGRRAAAPTIVAA